MSQKIVFMGTPEFAIPSLEAIKNSKNKILAVYSQPASKANRGQKLVESKVEITAKKLSLDVRTPKTLDSEEEYKFLNARWAERLFKTFGSEVENVLGRAQAKADLGRKFGYDLTEREVLWYINQEHVRCVEDLIWRRSKLGLRLTSEQIKELNAYIKKLN